MLSVVTDEGTKQSGSLIDEASVKAPAACSPPPWKQKSTSTQPSWRPRPTRLVAVWWSATATTGPGASSPQQGRSRSQCTAGQ